MGILGKITDKFSSSSIKDKNSNTFMHLQKQSESISIDIEVLMKSCETYVKLFNKKSKAPQNLVNQGNSKGNKKAPLELMSLASLQCSQTLDNSCHLSKVFMEYSDSHRHMYEKQKTMAESLNAYILYLNESLEDFKKYQTSKNLYAKNAKTFVSYQNKLKKQTQPITAEQKSKVEVLYKNYTQSLHTLVEKMAYLTSNKKEEERTKNFLHLIDNEINFYQDVTNELLQLRENIKKNDEYVGDNRYSEKKTESEYVEEIMGNKLELENFTIGLAQTPVNGSATKIVHESSESQMSNFSSKDNSYQNLGLTDYNGNNYNYDYNTDGYYREPYDMNANGSDQQMNVMNGTTMYSNNISNPEPVDNLPNPLDDYLNPSTIKNTTDTKNNNAKPKRDRSSIFSDEINLEDSLRLASPTSPDTPLSSNDTTTKRKSVINNENLANVSMNEKVYNTKELNPKYCKAIYPFSKSMEDELELEANDLVDITKKFDDGWATGINLRSGQEGFFPLNCLLEFYVTDKFADYGGSKENSESYVYSTTN